MILHGQVLKSFAMLAFQFFAERDALTSAVNSRFDAPSSATIAGVANLGLQSAASLVGTLFAKLTEAAAKKTKRTKLHDTSSLRKRSAWMKKNSKTFQNRVAEPGRDSPLPIRWREGSRVTVPTIAVY